MRDFSLRNIECLGYKKSVGDKMYEKMKKEQEEKKLCEWDKFEKELNKLSEMSSRFRRMKI